MSFTLVLVTSVVLQTPCMVCSPGPSCDPAASWGQGPDDLLLPLQPYTIDCFNLGFQVAPAPCHTLPVPTTLYVCSPGALPTQEPYSFGRYVCLRLACLLECPLSSRPFPSRMFPSIYRLAWNPALAFLCHWSFSQLQTQLSEI